MNIPRNLTFSIDLQWDGKTGGQVNFGDHGSLKIDALPEFGGEGNQPCPDELFLAAIGGCLLTTLLYVRRKLGLHLVDVRISVDGEARLHGPDGYQLTSVNATIYIKTPKEQEALAEQCVKLTQDFCHLTRLVEKMTFLKLWAKIDSIEKV